MSIGLSVRAVASVGRSDCTSLAVASARGPYAEVVNKLLLLLLLSSDKTLPILLPAF
jgi:hypothetical protein